MRRGMLRVSALRPFPDDLILCINDDTEVENDFLERAVNEIDQHRPGVMLSVPTTFRDSGRRDDGCFVSYWPRFTFRRYDRHPERIDCANTRCLLIPYADLLKCGAFRPGLLPHYLSDFEFTIRARRRGIRIVPAATVSCSSTEASTGLHAMVGGSSREIIRKMFSPKYAANPVHMFMFILLAAPFRWKIVCWVHAFRSFIGSFLLTTIVSRMVK